MLGDDLNPKRVYDLYTLGLGFGVWGLGFGVWGLGFGVWVSEPNFRVHFVPKICVLDVLAVSGVFDRLGFRV